MRTYLQRHNPYTINSSNEVIVRSTDVCIMRIMKKKSTELCSYMKSTNVFNFVYTRVEVAKSTNCIINLGFLTGEKSTQSRLADIKLK